LAENSHLFIASDAPKSEKSEDVIKEIRNYSKSIKGFREVELISFQKNLGAAESFKESFKQVFSKYDRLIYTEDDNIFSSNFLEFINKGLDYYRDDSRIFSICGYRHPFKMPKNYSQDIFFSIMMSAWGWGIWKDRYMSVNINEKDFSDVKRKKLHKRMSNTWQLIMENINSGEVYGDAVMELYCLKNNLLNVFPRISLVQNYGNDGSGAHCSINENFRNQEMASGYEVFSFSSDIEVSRQIERRLVDSVDFPFQGKLRRVYSRIRAKIMTNIRGYFNKRPKLKSFILNNFRNK
jgi:hypothetical protein